MTLGHAHPDDPSLQCGEAGPHRLCTAYDTVGDRFVDWPNPDYVPPAPKRGRDETSKTLRDIRSRVRPASRTTGEGASPRS